MPRLNGVIGIDLGTDTVKAVLLEVVKGEDMPRVVSVAAVPSQGMRKGVVLESENTALAIRQALEILQKTADISNVGHFVGIGGIGLEYQKAKGLSAVSRADGEVSADDVKRAMSSSESALSRVQNREILHRIPLIYRIDNDTTASDPIGLNGIKLEVEAFFVTSFVHHLKGILKAFDEARLEADDVSATPLALTHAVVTKRERESGVMILDMGAATTSLITFEEGLPYSLEVIPWGSAHITNDIVKGFQVSMDDAEKLKINYGAVASAAGSSKKDDAIYGSYSKRKLTDIIEARLGDIFELVEKHLKKVDRAGLLPAGVVLVGGGANLNGIADFAKEYLQLPVRVVVPENLGGFKDKVNNPAWAGAVGIALMAISGKGVRSPMFRGRSGTLLKWLRAFLP